MASLAAEMGAAGKAAMATATTGARGAKSGPSRVVRPRGREAWDKDSPHPYATTRTPPATLGVRVVLSAVLQYYTRNFISSQCGVEMHGNGLDGQLITHTPSLQHKPLTNPIIRARDGLRTHQGQHTHGDP